MAKRELGDIWKDRISWVVQLPHGVMRTKTKRVAEAHKNVLAQANYDAWRTDSEGKAAPDDLEIFWSR